MINIYKEETSQEICVVKDSLIFSSEFAQRYIENCIKKQGGLIEFNYIFLIKKFIAFYLKAYNFNYDFLKQLIFLNISNEYYKLIEKCFYPIDILYDCSLLGLSNNDFLQIKEEIIKYYYEANANDFFVSDKTIKILKEKIYNSQLNSLKEMGVYFKKQNFKTDLISKIERETISCFPELNLKSALDYVLQIIKKEQGNKFNLDKNRIIFINRLSGKSLKECDETISRERSRQIVDRLLQHLSKILVFEERFCYFYINYQLNEEDFSFIFKVNKEEYAYLSLLYKKGSKTITNLYEDLYLSESYKKRIEILLSKKYIFIDGKAFKLEKSFIFNYILEKQNVIENNKLKYLNVSINDIINKYNSFIDNEKIDESFKIENTASIKGIIERSSYCITGLGEFVKYFNLKEINLENFLDNINLLEYNNKQIGLFVVFNKNKKYLMNLGIENEYELHNMLKKSYNILDNEYNWKNKKYKNIVFNRMPNIQIGKVDLEEQINELILKLAPIKVTDFIKRYAEIYGEKEESFRANKMNYLEKYIRNNMICLNNNYFNDEEFDFLKKILKDDVYSFVKLETIFMLVSNVEFKQLLNDYNLSYLNYNIREGYIYNKKYTRIEDCILNYCNNLKFFTLKEIKNYMGLNNDSSVPYYILKTLLKEQKILEIKKENYCVVDYYEKILKIDIEEISKLLLSLKKYLDIYPYFTIDFILKEEAWLEKYILKMGSYCLGSLFWTLSNCYCIKYDNSIVLTSLKNPSKDKFIEYLKNENKNSSNNIEEILLKEYGIY